MTNNWSKFGDRFARPTGASELMEDLGLASALKNDVLLLGGGNPGIIPAMQTLFRDYFENMIKQEIDSKKTERGKERYKVALKDGLRFIDRNQTALYFAIASHISLQRAKNFLVSKLAEIQSVGHFIRTPNGYKVTAPEGYVAVDKVAGAVKLVDRLEFSRANFTAEKDWVKG